MSAVTNQEAFVKAFGPTPGEENDQDEHSWKEDSPAEEGTGKVGYLGKLPEVPDNNNDQAEE